VTTADQSLEMAALAVGELQIQLLLAERPDVFFDHVVDLWQAATHASLRAKRR